MIDINWIFIFMVTRTTNDDYRNDKIITISGGHDYWCSGQHWMGVFWIIELRAAALPAGSFLLTGPWRQPLIWQHPVSILTFAVNHGLPAPYKYPIDVSSSSKQLPCLETSERIIEKTNNWASVSALRGKVSIDGMIRRRDATRLAGTIHNIHS